MLEYTGDDIIKGGVFSVQVQCEYNALHVKRAADLRPFSPVTKPPPAVALGTMVVQMRIAQGKSVWVHSLHCAESSKLSLSHHLCDLLIPPRCVLHLLLSRGAASNHLSVAQGCLRGGLHRPAVPGRLAFPACTGLLCLPCVWALCVDASPRRVRWRTRTAASWGDVELACTDY